MERAMSKPEFKHDHDHPDPTLFSCNWANSPNNENYWVSGVRSEHSA